VIELKARLLPDEQAADEIDKTMAEFTRACQWLHDHASTQYSDYHSLRQNCYQMLRRETLLGTALCAAVFAVVAAYRRACDELGMQGIPLLPSKLVYHANSLNIKGRSASILLLSGRSLVDFDLSSPEDYRLLKSSSLKRGELYCEGGSWLLGLRLLPSKITYTPDGVIAG